MACLESNTHERQPVFEQFHLPQIVAATGKRISIVEQDPAIVETPGVPASCAGVSLRNKGRSAVVLLRLADQDDPEWLGWTELITTLPVDVVSRNHNNLAWSYWLPLSEPISIVAESPGLGHQTSRALTRGGRGALSQSPGV